MHFGTPLKAEDREKGEAGSFGLRIAIGGMATAPNWQHGREEWGRATGGGHRSDDAVLSLVRGAATMRVGLRS
jgi:hypothetical protein